MTTPPDQPDDRSTAQPADRPPRAVRITPEQARPIRHAVLRPGQPSERLIYPSDDDPRSVHLGVFAADGTLIAVASFYQEPVPGTQHPATRLRGMATLPEHRGRGCGRQLIAAALETVPDAHGVPTPTLWCNARISAAAYYEKLGFTKLGEIFDIPDIGPHAVMVLDAGPTTPAAAPRTR